jgi:F0F1-type ATP synthase assembly protein I
VLKEVDLSEMTKLHDLQNNDVMKKSQDSHNQSQPVQTSINLWALSAAVGIRILVPVLIFVLGGIKLDKQFHTLPWITISAIFVSFVISIILIARMITSYNSPNKS